MTNQTQERSMSATHPTIAAVRAMAEATPNPCEGSLGHLRDDFAWELEQNYIDATKAGDTAEQAACLVDAAEALARWSA
jgi:nucleoside diphosphate kinase